ncbi:hypothetical protein [Hyphomicrobium sp. D-2]|uniref:hypothetical protein n=1 Tax=Hyphomicrobium sp. D-2 TaxID=3041621 RepID=UPI002458FA34|nr:hypothetical protein [Hyphomicrobium sp. D-2]MDH4982788.1 hypothetical protein [Hyphomicrobium sp. D-2]
MSWLWNWLSGNAQSISIFGGGFFTLCIALWKWRTNTQKVKLDLFDRRLAIYNATMDLVCSVRRDGQLNWDQLRAFSRDTRDARFLFGDKLAKHLAEMDVRAELLIREEKEYRRIRDENLEGIEPVLDRLEAITDWFKNTSEERDRMFQKSLSLAGWRPSLGWLTRARS